MDLDRRSVRCAPSPCDAVVMPGECTCEINSQAHDLDMCSVPVATVGLSVTTDLTRAPTSDTSPSDNQEDHAELNTTFSSLAVVKEPLIPVDKFSSFTLYKRVTAWMMRFIHNCRAKIKGA